MNKTNTIILALVGIIVIGALFWVHGLGSSTAPSAGPITVDPRVLPGIQTSPAPWEAEIPNLLGRLQAIGLPPLAEEGTALHIHQHIDVFVHGKPVVVPAGIGINESAGFISPVHTHDTTGVIHVESPTIRDFTLGEFFDVWGVAFDANTLGGYAADANDTLKVFVNGTLFTGDPRTIVLAAHQEIAVVYGTAQESPAPIPADYTFAPGL